MIYAICLAGLIAAAIIALNIWQHRLLKTMTPEDREAFKTEDRIHGDW